LAAELTAVRDLLITSSDLAQALVDGGVSAQARAGMVEDLLSSRTLSETWRLVRFVVQVERPVEIIESVGQVSERVDDELSRVEGEPDLDPPAGRTELWERIEGFALARFEVVNARATLQRVEDELFSFAAVVDASSELGAVLGDNFLPAEVRRGVATGLLFGKVDALTLELVNYAVTSCRGAELVRVLNKLAEQTAAELGRRVAEVRSPFPLSSEQSEQLATVLSRVVSRPVELRVSEDPSLIGGVVALLGDTLVDASVRQRLAQLEVALMGEA
jgi:F-type H+-transporting ATPase subunit delta